jgi:hypothetical protein
MALTNRNAVKAQAGISSSDTSRDTQIDLLISGVTSLVKQQLNRDIEAADYTEYYSGDNSPFLLLRQFPVNSITAIYYDNAAYFGDAPGAFDTSTLLTSGVDYSLMDGLNGKGGQGIVRRVGSIWYGRPSRRVGTVENLQPIDMGNIKVVYNAGYTIIPAAILMGVNMLISQLVMQASAGGGASSMSYEDAGVTFLTPDVAAKAWGSIASVFAQFKSIPI